MKNTVKNTDLYQHSIFKLQNINLIAKTLRNSESLVSVSVGKEKKIVLFPSGAITSKREKEFLKL